MTLKTIRNGIHKIDTYLNAALDLFGGDDGLCHFRCSDGEPPFIFLTIFCVHVDVLSGEISRARLHTCGRQEMCSVLMLLHQ